MVGTYQPGKQQHGGDLNGQHVGSKKRQADLFGSNQRAGLRPLYADYDDNHFDQ